MAITIFLVYCIMAILPLTPTFAETYGISKPKDNEVAIVFSGVEVPLDKILLIRKDDHYCAVQFIRTWTEIDQERLKTYEHDISFGGSIAETAKNASTKKYAIYKSYYPKNGSSEFSRADTKINEDKVTWLPLQGPFRPFIYQPGDTHVKCGPYILGWEYKTFLSVIPRGKYMGDHGFELAPTPWSNLGEINTKDPRIKWYRYNEERERMFIIIDKLWESD